MQILNAYPGPLIKNHGGFPEVPAPASFCSAMTFSEAVATNSDGVLVNNATGQQLTVTNDGGGYGVYILLSSQSWSSTTGTVSFELLWNSSTDVTNGEIGLGIYNAGATNAIQLSYFPATGILQDVIASSTLATFSAVQGSYRMGIKLDMGAGTATYQDNHSTPHSGSLSVAGDFDNSNPFNFVFYANTPTSGVTVVTAATGTVPFVLAQSNNRWCEYS